MYNSAGITICCHRSVEVRAQGIFIHGRLLGRGRVPTCVHVRGPSMNHVWPSWMDGGYGRDRREGFRQLLADCTIHTCLRRRQAACRGSHTDLHTSRALVPPNIAPVLPSCLLLGLEAFFWSATCSLLKLVGSPDRNRFVVSVVTPSRALPQASDGHSSRAASMPNCMPTNGEMLVAWLLG